MAADLGPRGGGDAGGRLSARRRAAGPGRRGVDPALPRRAGHRLVHRERRLPGGGRRGRQQQHPPGPRGSTLPSQGAPATASSTESAAYPAADAVDGNTSTRWSSAFSDPQWLEVDLGASQTICEVTLDWEAAYAQAFQIQASADGTNW